jgi:hypothetical protein
VTLRRQIHFRHFALHFLPLLTGFFKKNKTSKQVSKQSINQSIKQTNKQTNE